MQSGMATSQHLNYSCPVNEVAKTSFTRIVSHLSLLTLVGLLTLTPGNATLPLLDRDEPRFARATVEMMRTGDWVVPYFNGAYRFDKPVLTYWMMSVGYRVFGIGEFGARAHSVLAAILTAFAIYGMGRRVFSPTAGLLAAFAWLTSFQTLFHGRSAVADMPMILCVTMAQWAFYELGHGGNNRHGRIWFLVAYLALGLGFLAKGPVALFVPALTLGLYRLLSRTPLPWRRLRIAEGLLVVLLIAAAWGLPALFQTGGLFWREGMNRHVVERGLESFNNRQFIPLFYYPATLLFSLFPWIAFAGATITSSHPIREPRIAFLLAWFLSPFFIFSFYATQLPHYTMPGFPAALLLIGYALDHPPETRRWHKRFFYGVMLCFAVMASGATILALFWPLPVLASLRWSLLGFAIIIIGLTLILFFGRNARVVFPLGTVAIGFAFIGHGVRAVHPAVQLAPIIAVSSPETEWAAWRYTEPTLVFYGDRPSPWRMLGAREDLQNWIARRHRAAAVVVLESEAKLDRLLHVGRHGEPRTVARDYAVEYEDILRRAGWRPGPSVQGLNTGRGTWVALRVWRSPE